MNASQAGGRLSAWIDFNRNGDWSDAGECHDYEDIHRDTGRIYKIAHGNSRKLFRL